MALNDYRRFPPHELRGGCFTNRLIGFQALSIPRELIAQSYHDSLLGGYQTLLERRPEFALEFIQKSHQIRRQWFVEVVAAVVAAVVVEWWAADRPLAHLSWLSMVPI